jgi:hypothetical protein
MKFKILEKVLDAFKEGNGTYYIYINPTPQELRGKDESRGNRGIIDPEGNLYVEAKWQEDGEGVVYSEWIHDTLLGVLQDRGLFISLEYDWHVNPKNFHHGLAVQRLGKSLDFYMAESYSSEIEDTEELNALIKKMFSLAKKKNPSLNFHEVNIESIYEENEGEDKS